MLLVLYGDSWVTFLLLLSPLVFFTLLKQQGPEEGEEPSAALISPSSPSESRLESLTPLASAGVKRLSQLAVFPRRRSTLINSPRGEIQGNVAHLKGALFTLAFIMT